MLGNALSPCDKGIIQAQRCLPGTSSASSQPTSQPSSAGADAAARKGYALAATVLGSSMAFIDGSVVNIALPAIQRNFAGSAGAGLAAMQWVINASLLALGSLVVVGGWLGDAVSWRAIFFLNVPLAVATIWLAVYAVPDSRDPDAPRHFDWLGVLLVASGLGALTYGLTLAPERGWGHPSVLWPLVFGAAALAAFGVAQARVR